MKKSPDAKTSSSRPDFLIRPLTSFSDFEGCVSVQRKVWGHSDMDITPVHHFQIAVHTGAIVLGAFIEGKIAGYIYSFPADFGKVRGQHSHHLAVLPESQGLGLGKALKWAQREEALKRDLELLTWTFDPMLARNANLNIHALGAIGRRYLRDFYGETPALVLDAGVPSDRLLVEWWIKSPRVKARKNGPPAPLDPERLPKALERAADGAGPGLPVLDIAGPRILVEIPKKIRDLPKGTGVIGAWQAAARGTVEEYFARGFGLEDFIAGERSFYVLKRIPPRGHRRRRRKERP
jgi:predicted GNAT superfamily acetyltransferase